MLRFKNLEMRKRKPLAWRGAKWKMKRRVVWLEKGNENIIFSHNLLNHGKIINIIWEL
jgi:hypothetical protein